MTKRRFSVTALRILFLLALIAAFVLFTSGRRVNVRQLLSDAGYGAPTAGRYGYVPERPHPAIDEPSMPDTRYGRLPVAPYGGTGVRPPGVVSSDVAGKWRGSTILSKEHSFCIVILTLKTTGTQLRGIHRLDCVGMGRTPVRYQVVTGVVGSTGWRGASLPDGKILFRTPTADACQIQSLEVFLQEKDELTAYWRDPTCGPRSSIRLTRVKP
jgi:hypothetical protein